MDFGEFPSRTPRQRMDYFKSRLSAMGLDACWEAHPPNVRYLSGFTGEESTLLVTPKRSVLVTDSRFVEQAQAETCVEEIVSRQKAMAATVAVLCRKLGVRKLGVTASHVSYADWQSLTSGVGSADVVTQEEGLADRMRVRKSREELLAIASALAIAQDAFRRFREKVAPGRTEKWLAAALEWEMRSAGAEAPAFKTICAVDERASLPHAICTDKKLRRGSTLLVDWGARAGGYNSDLTRVLGTGTMPRFMNKLAQLVLEAQQAAFDELAPGRRCCDIDRAARKVIARAGYGRYFGHGLGHGLGLEVHEAPRLAATEADILLPGAVVTVEPGIYLPGVGGVRIEDVAVITRSGHEIISSLERWPLDA